jgi:hypothetical protein
VTNCAVVGPLAWTSGGWLNGAVGGTSLFFGTVNIESGSSIAAAATHASGATIYVLNTNAVFATNSTDTKNVNYRFEYGVSGFFCGPVISENIDGVSVYMVGLDGTTGSGNTLYCYDGFDIDRNTPANWQIGQHESAGINGVTIFATPCLGKNAYDFNDNIYSGNSLFVVDGLGGVSVYNKNTGALVLATVYGEINNTTTGNVSYAGPVTNGAYLALCNDNGVTVYGSQGANDLQNGNSSSWLWRSGDMTIANGWTENWRLYATPAISHNHLVVAAAATDAAGNERAGGGAIFVFRITDGTLVDSYFLPTAAVASPALSNGCAWMPEYTSSIHRINLGSWVEANGWWRQFKYDAAKTGDNSEEQDDDEVGDSSGCFISTLK